LTRSETNGTICSIVKPFRRLSECEAAAAQAVGGFRFSRRAQEVSMIEARFHPITNWPKEPTPKDARKHRFRAPWSNTLDLLEYELSRLDASDITIQAFFRSNDIRNDGWPYANARPSQPGVILKFTTDRGEAEFACDRFADWQQNLRAIALGLEKLRLVSDYGIAEAGEQYRGWLKLNGGDPNAVIMAHASIIVAALDSQGMTPLAPEDLLLSRQVFEKAAADALRAVHPDLNGGNDAGLQEVLAARNAIRQMKGWS
jgi:hypothetical protein